MKFVQFVAFGRDVLYITPLSDTLLNAEFGGNCALSLREQS